MGAFLLGSITTSRSEFMDSRYHIRIEITAIRDQSMLLAYTTIPVVASVNESSVHYQSRWWDIDKPGYRSVP